MKHAKTDAGTRAKRTLIQGLAVAVLIAVAGVLLEIVSAWSPSDMVNVDSWILLTLSIVQVVLTSAASWVQRTLEGKSK